MDKEKADQFKSAGEKASEAGRKLRKAMLELSQVADKTNYNLIEYKEKMIDLDLTLRRMKHAMKDFTEEEREEWLLSIFSREAYEALIILLDDLD